MFGLYSPKAIPSAREVSVMKTLGVTKLEFAQSRKIEADLNNLRDSAYDLIKDMVENKGDSRFISLGDVSPEAIIAVSCELKALGYKVETHDRLIKFSVPSKKAAA